MLKAQPALFLVCAFMEILEMDELKTAIETLRDPAIAAVVAGAVIVLTVRFIRRISASI